MHWVWWWSIRVSRNGSHKVTFESGGTGTVVDYVLVRRQDRAIMLDVKVMCESQCDKEGTDKKKLLRNQFYCNTG